MSERNLEQTAQGQLQALLRAHVVGIAGASRLLAVAANLKAVSLRWPPRTLDHGRPASSNQYSSGTTSLPPRDVICGAAWGAACSSLQGHRCRTVPSHSWQAWVVRPPHEPAGLSSLLESERQVTHLVGRRTRAGRASWQSSGNNYTGRSVCGCQCAMCAQRIVRVASAAARPRCLPGVRSARPH